VLIGEQTPPPAPPPPPLVRALDSQTDLRQLPPEDGVLVWANAAWVPRNGDGAEASVGSGNRTGRLTGVALALFVALACLAEGVTRRRRAGRRRAGVVAASGAAGAPGAPAEAAEQQVESAADGSSGELVGRPAGSDGSPDEVVGRPAGADGSPDEVVGTAGSDGSAHEAAGSPAGESSSEQVADVVTDEASPPGELEAPEGEAQASPVVLVADDASDAAPPAVPATSGGGAEDGTRR
jgi:hypothetical protein